MVKKLVILILVAFPGLSLTAQNLETGLLGGVSYYNGDLNPGVPYNKVKPVYGFLGRYSKGTRWAFTANFITGTYASDTRYARASHVTESIFEKSISSISVVAEFNFYDYFTGSQKDYVTPYIFAGFGVFGTADAIGFTERLAFNRMNFPFGVGFKYSISERIGFSAEWRMNKAFADDLDNVFRTPEASPSNYNTLPYDDKGTNDWFNFTTIALTYKFNLSKKHSCNNFDNQQYY